MSKHTLRFSNPPQSSSPHLNINLPDNITRRFIPTPSGTLEILCAQPKAKDDRKKALIFQHGGFGSASVWIPFLAYFSNRGYPCYALSLRGHGASWSPSYLRFVYFTTKSTMASDLSLGFSFVRYLESTHRGQSLKPEDLVLVGHSAGGGLSQYFLSQKLGHVGGLVLMAPFPNFGGWGVYINWFLLDPWFLLRFIVQLYHPRSPLSNTKLLRNAFFSTQKDEGEIQEFEELMPEVESLIWPIGMMFRFVNIENVVRSIVGWAQGKEKILVIAGQQDTLMGVPLMERMTAEYRIAVEKILGSSEGREQEQSRVRFVAVEGTGHQMMNDVKWGMCANYILEFVEGL